MTPIKLPTLGYFRNENSFLGSSGALRFQIEKPDEEGNMTVVLWQGPFSRPYAQEIERESFPLNDAGLNAMLGWLSTKAREMEEHPVFTQAEVNAFYQAKKAEEQAPPEEAKAEN